MFKLNGLGALELSVEEKYARPHHSNRLRLTINRKDEVQVQKLQLDDLEAKLREATERLKSLEANHRRGKSQNVLSTNRTGRPAVRPVVEETEETDDSGGESRSEGRSEDGKRFSR